MRLDSEQKRMPHRLKFYMLAACLQRQKQIKEKLKEIVNGNHFKGQSQKSKFKATKKYNSYPSQYKFSRTGCDHCGRYHHKKPDCYHYKRSLKQGTQMSNSTSAQTNIAEGEGFAFMMCQPCSTNDNNNNEVLFILDSGASDHIIKSHNFYETYETLLQPMQISVAKAGESITATKRGTIQVISNLEVPGCLENVLFAPKSCIQSIGRSSLARKGNENNLRC